ncbi:MAG: multiheme c-type cytochrome, partial [Myxococcota bacterium]|nr:multiheme c-type cytochrome [Myxococcota bacterium]
MKRKTIAFWALSFCCAVIALWTLAYADGPDVAAMGEGLHGKYSYEDFSKPEYCAQCHVDIARQWEQSWMAKAYDSPWDEIEYFELAVEHGKRNPKFAPVADGCNGCHAPISFMAGDTPPPRPAENSRANESVSCEVCHTISAIDESKLYNFSFFASPGRVMYGARGGESSPVHDLARTDFHDSAKLCANCHNEQSP